MTVTYQKLASTTGSKMSLPLFISLTTNKTMFKIHALYTASDTKVIKRLGPTKKMEAGVYCESLYDVSTKKV